MYKKIGGAFIQWIRNNKRKWTPNSFNEMNETTKKIIICERKPTQKIAYGLISLIWASLVI